MPAPDALKFADQLAHVPNRIHAGLHADETAQLCQWHLPLSHALESWGDGRAVDGSATIIQPVVAPLYASRSMHQLVDMLLGASRSGSGCRRACDLARCIRRRFRRTLGARAA